MANAPVSNRTAAGLLTGAIVVAAVSLGLFGPLVGLKTEQNMANELVLLFRPWHALALIAGAVVVESVFSWPGVGRLLVVAVANRDLAVVQCILLLVAATMVTSNLIVDFLYGFLDPRLRSREAAAAH